MCECISLSVCVGVTVCGIGSVNMRGYVDKSDYDCVWNIGTECGEREHRVNMSVNMCHYMRSASVCICECMGVKYECEV